MRWLKIISAILATGIIVLAAHIYFVTHPRLSGASRGVARIDLHQPISQTDAYRITTWLQRQKGVDHALVSARSAIAVFTYLPQVANAGRITTDLRDSLCYPRAVRYLPSAAEARAGCPLRATPVTNGLYQLLKRVF